nr:aspartyl protease family protein At5g10770-like [Ipomoea batatas]
MASRKGPCRPSYNPAKTISSTQQHFQSKKIDDDASADSMEYFFTVGLGTPKSHYNLFVDTGSDNTWVRCQPCRNSGCKSNGPLFDPSKSKTYVNESCRSTTDQNNNYVFKNSYIDGSAAIGHWGCDTLTIEKHHSYVVKNFQFGCVQEIEDLVGDNFGGDDGILGLGRGDLSLPSQAGFPFHIFGYCIPKRNSRLGYFLFGSEAAKMSSSSHPKFTRLLNNAGEPFYYVELKGISVAGKKLDIDASDLNNESGSIIDSGTTYTHLPIKAFSALRTAFNQTMVSIYPAASSQLMPELDTICYNVDGIDTTTFHVPPITFHFAGMSQGEIIDVELRPPGILMTTKSNLVCLGFTTSQNDTLTIFGNHQQRQMGMFFDLQRERIGFGTKNCAE